MRYGRLTLAVEASEWTHEFDNLVFWYGTGDGLLFLADYEDVGRSVYALDAATGSVIREIEASGEVKDFVDGLFLTTHARGFNLVNAATGETKELLYEDGFATYLPEALGGGVVYMGLKNAFSVQTTLYRFETYDADSLERLSRSDDKLPCGGTWLVSMRGVLFCSSAHDTSAFDRTGENLWISEGTGDPVIAGDGVVYTGGDSRDKYRPASRHRGVARGIP